MSTFIKTTCPKCGYSNSYSIYGYVKNPIGIPLVRCEVCGNIFKTEKQKEWIQMSPLKKFYAIAPRWIPCGAFGVSLILSVGFVRVILENLNDTVGSIFSLGVLVLGALLGAYLTAWLLAGSEKFTQQYLESLKRTRNPIYQELLGQYGKLYDESMPFGIRIPGDKKSRIEDALRQMDSNESIRIPTVRESVMNMR